jgi:F-type H+-transporting ATPase subunit alpha
MVLYAATNGYADHVSVDKIRDWEEALLRHLNGSAPDVSSAIDREKAISKETEDKLKKALEVFSAAWA